MIVIAWVRLMGCKWININILERSVALSVAEEEDGYEQVLRIDAGSGEIYLENQEERIDMAISNMVTIAAVGDMRRLSIIDNEKVVIERRGVVESDYK